MPPGDDFLTKRAKVIIYFVERLGLPVALVVVFVWGSWLVGSRLVVSHEKFIESLAAEHIKQGTTLVKIADSQTEAVKILGSLDKRMRGDKYTVLATKPDEQPVADSPPE